MNKTIFEHKVKVTMSQGDLMHLIYLLRKDLENCGSIGHIQVYTPLFASLEKQFKEQGIKDY